MNKFLDLFLSTTHLLLVFFNLFGWIPKKTRRLHLISIGLTAFSWLVLGIWFGVGYCPLTDWQWKLKWEMGERNLPASFITYFLNKISETNFYDEGVNVVTAICFAAATTLSLFFNKEWIKRKLRGK